MGYVENYECPICKDNIQIGMTMIGCSYQCGHCKNWFEIVLQPERLSEREPVTKANNPPFDKQLSECSDEFQAWAKKTGDILRQAMRQPEPRHNADDKTGEPTTSADAFEATTRRE